MNLNNNYQDAFEKNGMKSSEILNEISTPNEDTSQKRSKIFGLFKLKRKKKHSQEKVQQL